MTNLSKIFLSLFCLLMAAPLVAQIPESHAPIGVMGDHTHGKGEWMVSYRYMRMWMEGNRTGTDAIDNQTIVTTVPNRFAGMPMQPPTLRVAPTYMAMDMHMLGLMYAPTRWLTLMAMGSLVQNKMNHITYKGGMGTAQAGNFVTQTQGLGDLRLVGLVNVVKTKAHKVHVNVGASLPTGSIDTEHAILTPLETQPTVRLPYPMQLGSGTTDALLGLTYNGFAPRLAWGTQLMSTLRTGQNAAGYRLGNQLQASVWGSHRLKPWASASLRATFQHTNPIQGIDSRIMAPVQTANPDFSGGQRLDLAVGLNLLSLKGFSKNHRLAAEFAVPVYQRLNGPQLETDYVLTLGWQLAF